MTTQWKGGARGLWRDPDNWTGGVPTASDPLLFDTGMQNIGLGQHRAAASLSVAGARLTLHGGLLDLTAIGPDPDLTLSAQASLTLNHGAWVIAHNVFARQGDSLTVHGTLTADYAKFHNSSYPLHSTLTISGPDARWVVEKYGVDLRRTDFTLSDGARLVAGHDATYASTFLDLDGPGTGLITGAGTRLDIGNLNVSRNQRGATLTVQNGAQVFARDAFIGYTSAVTISHAGLHTSHQLYVYRLFGSREDLTRFTIQDHSVVTVGYGGIVLFGTLTIDSTSVLTAPYIFSHTGTIVASSGTVTLHPEVIVGINNRDAYLTSLTLSSDPGATLVLDGSIESRSSDNAALTIGVAAGHVVLAAPNADFTGTTQIYAGTLEIAALGAAGTGGLTFMPYSDTMPGTLLIDDNLAFDNAISGFAHHDVIDLAAFDFYGARAGAVWTPSSTGGTLTLDNHAGQQEALHFVGAGLSAASFNISSDMHGGTVVDHT